MPSSLVVDPLGLFTNTVKDQPKVAPVSIAVKDLSYAVPLPTKRSAGSLSSWVRGKDRSSRSLKPLLQNIRFCLRSGESLAIIGPSGCSKTTLLNLLMGRFIGGTRAGGIYYNGEELTAQEIGTFSNYVTAEDTLLPFLTVEETLMMSARLKLVEMNSEDRQKRVDQVIAELALESCRKTQVGGVWRKGISSGEMKRVCIGIELLDNPSCLLLDEPTTGLDASLANDLMKLLARQQNQGRTLICSIHQPRSQVFYSFDKVLLMSAGRMVYFGPTSSVIDYFKQLGHPCPPRYNPADFLLELVTIRQSPLTKLADVPSSSVTLASSSTSNFDSFVKPTGGGEVEMTTTEAVAEGTSSPHDILTAQPSFTPLGIIGMENSFDIDTSPRSDIYDVKKEILEDEVRLGSNSSIAASTHKSSHHQKDVHWRYHDRLTADALISLVEKFDASPEASDLTDNIERVIEETKHPVDPLIAAVNLVERYGDPRSIRKWFHQTAVLTHRCFLNGYRNPAISFAFWGLQCFEALILGGIFWKLRTQAAPYEPLGEVIGKIMDLLPTSSDSSSLRHYVPSANVLSSVRSSSPEFHNSYVPSTEDEQRAVDHVEELKDFWSTLTSREDIQRDEEKLLLNLFPPNATVMPYPLHVASSVVDLIVQRLDQLEALSYQCRTNNSIGFYSCCFFSHPLPLDFPAEHLHSDIPVWLKHTPSSSSEASQHRSESVLPTPYDKDQESGKPVKAIQGLLIDASRMRDDGSRRRLGLTTLPPWGLFEMIKEWLMSWIREIIKNKLFPLLIDIIIGAVVNFFAGFNLLGGMYFLVGTIAFASFNGCLTFPRERVVMNREMACNMYRCSSFVVAKSLAELPFQFIPCFWFSLIVFLMSEAYTSFGSLCAMLAVSLCTCFATYGYGYVVSAASPTMEVAILVAPLLVTVFAVLAGFFLPVSEIKGWIGWLGYLDFYRWSYFGLIGLAFPKGDDFFGMFPNSMFRVVGGVRENTVAACAILLLVLGVGYRLLSYVCVRFLYRNVGVH